MYITIAQHRDGTLTVCKGDTLDQAIVNLYNDLWRVMDQESVIEHARGEIDESTAINYQIGWSLRHWWVGGPDWHERVR